MTDTSATRPPAQIDADGVLHVRASASLKCLRALWHAANGATPQEPSEDTLMMWDTGKALEPVVCAAMERKGWEVEQDGATVVTIDICPTIKVAGTPDAYCWREEYKLKSLYSVIPPEPDTEGPTQILEIKTRNSGAFRRWQTLGAERSHPQSVAQLALYTWGTFNHWRDGVIATMDVGNRTWDYEIIPWRRLQAMYKTVCERLQRLQSSLRAEIPVGCENGIGCYDCAEYGLDSQNAAETPQEAAETVSDEDAELAMELYQYASADMYKDASKAKKDASSILKDYAMQNGGKVEVAGHTVTVSERRTYPVNMKRLNKLLSPEQRAEIVSENVSHTVRVK